MSNKKYNKEIVIQKLIRHRIKPKHKKGSRNILFFRTSIFNTVGLKMWAYLDFLKKRCEFIKNKKRKKKTKLKTNPGYFYAFRWFNQKEKADEWVDLVKDKYGKSVKKSYVNRTKQNDFRVYVELSKKENL